jgi:hypothetical protein
MVGNTFIIRDAAIRPRPGQNVVLTFHGHSIRGVVDSLSRDCVRIRTESSLLARQLRLGTRLSAQIRTGDGTLEATLSLLSVQNLLVTLQFVGLPRLLQRRGHPRIAARMDATLTWLDRYDATPRQTLGTTQNVSLGGTLIRFPESTPYRPAEGKDILVSLALSATPTVAPIRVLQVWETGCRGRFLDLSADVADSLRAFIEPRLR